MTAQISQPYVSKKRGVSILETIVVLGIFSLVVLATTSFQKDIWRYYTHLSDTLLGQQEAKNTLRAVVKELRTASIGNTGAFPLTEVATSSLTFYSDIDADGLKEEIKYYMATTSTSMLLKKRVIKPTGNPLTYSVADGKITEVVHNIINSSTTPIFTYYGTNFDGTNAALTQPVTSTSVRLIKITFIVERNPGRSPIPMTITSQVSLRNLKDNL